MSVAFRRESDEEHKEPRFELPLPPGPNLVTARGFALTRARVTELEAAVSRAADQEARAGLQRHLRYWRTRLATATIAPLPPVGHVAFGSRVRLRLHGAERTIDIVGDDEAEPASGRIAFSAPLARAMMAAEAGEFLDFGDKPGAIEIMSIGVVTDMFHDLSK